jgi:hypothetical protein
MRSKQQQQPNQNPAPVYRSISQARVEQEMLHAGAAGQAALTAAALDQLNRYADDVQAFLREAQLDAILDRLQDDLDCADSDLHPLPPRRKP